MLGFIAHTVGGLIKDISIGASKVASTASSEVQSIPDAFRSGFSTGIITASKEVPDHHVDVVEETIAEKHGAPVRFGQPKAA